MPFSEQTFFPTYCLGEQGEPAHYHLYILIYLFLKQGQLPLCFIGWTMYVFLVNCKVLMTVVIIYLFIYLIIT